MIVVQIGANQGNDELTELLKDKHIEKLILVEPLDIHNDNLKQCYSNIKEVYIENIAIIDDPNQKEVSFYFHKEDRIEYGWGNYEISTLDKNHILKHGKTEEGIVEIRVPSMTINKLLDKYSLKDIDILFMDVEGFDHNILSSVDYNKFNIKDLYFENLHLKDKNQTEEFIKSKGFQIIDPAFGKGGWSTHIRNNNIKPTMNLYYTDPTPDSDWGVIETNKFSLKENQRKSFFVVDNFYEDPYALREFALQQTYFPGEGAVGSRTRKQFLFEGVKERFEEIMGIKIAEHTENGQGWKDGGINGRFQTCTAGTPLVYHCDSQQWAGMIYLTPDAPPQCGTSFFRHKETKVKHNSEINWEIGEGNKVFNQHTFLDGTPYELVDKIGNVFNRLVIFNGGLIHSASEYFGWDIPSSRLFHMFFFDAET